jgi:hypothetical protein
MEFLKMRRLSNLFKQKEPRREDRIIRKLPVKVYGDAVEGVTRDLSPSGVYFETESPFQAGSMIKMTIVFEGPEGLQLDCEGTIVRVENRGSDRVGVAVRMNPLRSTLTRSLENRVGQDSRKSDSRERLRDLNEPPSAGVVRCANPRSAKFGQPVGACEFRSIPECDLATRDYDKEFGCKFARLNVPAEAPHGGNA